jgi:nucleoid-associated protein YgaU
MARYRTTKKIKKDNTIYYRTTIYSKVPEKDTDNYFIAQEGDRCDNLAFRFYGNVQLWWFIAKVNNLTSMNIPAGTSLRIPATLEDAEGL